MKKNKSILASLICVVFFTYFFCTTPVIARVDSGGSSTSNTELTDQDIKMKGLYRTLKECYTDGKSLVSSFDYSSDNNTVNFIDTLFSPAAIFRNNDEKKNVPSGFLDVDRVPCSTKKGFKDYTRGILWYLNDLAPNKGKLRLAYPNDHPKERTDYYTGLGYTASFSVNQDVKEEHCISVKYEYTGVSRTTNSICYQLADNDSYHGGDIVNVYNDNSTQNFKDDDRIILYLEAWFNRNRLSGWGNGTDLGEKFDVSLNIIADIYDAEPEYDSTAVVQLAGLNNNYSWVSFRSSIDEHFESSGTIREELIDENRDGEIIDIPTSLKTSLNDIESNIKSDPNEQPSDIYTITDGKRGYASAYKYMGGQGSAWPAADFDRTELYYIYIKYLFSNFEPTPRIDYASCRDSDLGDESIPVVVEGDNDSKKMQYCLIDNYNVVKGRTDSVELNMTADMETTDIDFSGLVSAIRDLGGYINMDRIPILNLNSSSASINPTDSGQDSGQVEPTCANSGAGDSLGWILCPVLDFLSSSADYVYNTHVKPALEIDSNLFSDNAAGGTRYAWGIFQGFANTFLIILFLFVIFSQLTGVGIDNYGIKKILPKLIITAILINLSYVICLIFVDLSNILGNAFQSLFNNLPTGQMVDNVGGVSIGGIATGGLVGISLLAIIVVGIWAVIQNPVGILLPLLVSALAVIIAILFLFVLLAAREAAIIVLTVISPVAFALILLPNTKEVFDKWLKFSENLLLVYPICGLLIGAGNYVSKLLLSTGFASQGFTSAFAAIIIGIVPVFFIPTVLKNAFAALGNIGAKISGFGNRMRSGASKRIQNSNRYKDAMERGVERRARVRAGLNKDGTEKNLNSFQRFMRGGNKGIGRARTQYLKDRDAKARADRLTGVGYEAARISQDKAAEGDELKDYITLINSKSNNGENTKALDDMFAGYVASNNKTGAVAVARIAGRRKDTAASFLKNHFRDTDGYSDEIRSGLAKEIATGENSRNYLESAPLGFEFAAQMNRGDAKTTDYSSWVGASTTNPDGSANYGNVHSAVDNYVTDSKQLVGMKRGSLEELLNLASAGKMNQGDIERISNLAKETIKNQSTTGVFDTTKSDVIRKIADLVPSSSSAGTTGPSKPVQPVSTAKEGETFEVQKNRPLPRR